RREHTRRAMRPAASAIRPRRAATNTFPQPSPKRPTMKKAIALGIISLTLATAASAQVKPEDQIKFRQAGYSFMSWNMGKTKSNLEGEYNAQQVQAAATAIAGIAGSGMGALYGPGTEKDIGNLKTRVKPEFFQEMPNVGKLATDF